MKVFYFLFFVLFFRNVYASDCFEKLDAIDVGGYVEVNKYFNDLKSKKLKRNYEDLIDFYEVADTCESHVEELVIVHVSDILFQAAKNGKKFHNVDFASMYQKNIELLSSDNYMVSNVAMNVLAAADRADGFLVLLDVVSKGDERFSAAISAIYMMCRSFDEKRLEDVIKDLPSENKKIAKDIADGFGASVRRSSWCGGT